MKTFFLSTFILLFTTIKAQEISVKLSKTITLEVDSSFLIGGINTEKPGKYYLKKFNSNLQLIKEIELEAGKNDVGQIILNLSGNIELAVSPNFFFKKGLKFFLTKDLVLISQRELNEFDQSKVKEPEVVDKNLYQPGSWLDFKEGINPVFKVGTHIVELKWNNAPPAVLSDPNDPARISTDFGVNKTYAYKGEPKLIGLKPVGSDKGSYCSIQWESSLKGLEIQYYKFIPGTDEKFFLYLSVSKGKNLMEELILGVNAATGEILFQKTIALSDNTLQSAYSNAFYDNKYGKLILAGNYYDKKPNGNNILAYDNCRMKGYYLLFLNEQGEIIKDVRYPFQTEFPAGDQAKYITSRAACVQQIKSIADGEYQMVLEHFRFVTNETNGNEINNVKANINHTGQTFAFSLINFSIENGKKSEKVIPACNNINPEKANWKDDYIHFFLNFQRYDNFYWTIMQGNKFLEFSGLSNDGKTLYYRLQTVMVKTDLNTLKYEELNKANNTKIGYIFKNNTLYSFTTNSNELLIKKIN